MSEIATKDFAWKAVEAHHFPEEPVRLTGSHLHGNVLLSDWLTAQQAVQLGTQITQAGLRAAARQRAQAKLAAECEQSNRDARAVCDAVDQVMA